MDCVLHIPELLALILTVLPTQSLVHAACVSSSWSIIALDAIWYDVDDFRRLVNLLGPVQDDTNGTTYSFTRLPEAADWTRFSRYGPRVRCLHLHSRRKNPSAELFAALWNTSQSRDMLPNLHTLKWMWRFVPAPPNLHTTIFGLGFMQEHVERLTIRIPILGVDLWQTFGAIVTQMPFLTYLDIQTDVPMRTIEKEILVLFGGLKRLRKVVLPRFHFTERVAEALAHLEYLNAVDFQDVQDPDNGESLVGEGDPEDMRRFVPCLMAGAFAALSELSLSLRADSVVRFLEGKFAPGGLKVLVVASPDMEDPGTIHALLKAVSEQCHFIHSLRVLCAPMTSALVRRPSVWEQISFKTLKPLLSCPNIAHFEIGHHYPLALRQADLEVLARSLPALETLLLNAHPVMLWNSPLTLRALVPFARYCPNLQQLGLFLEASAEEMPGAEEMGVMDRLRELDVGVSCVTDAGAVALFLSRVCPLECVLGFGEMWELDEEQDFDDLGVELARRLEMWERVEEMVTLLARVREEERERTRVLVREIEDCVRVRLLGEEGRLGVHTG